MFKKARYDVTLHFFKTEKNPAWSTHMTMSGKELEEMVEKEGKTYIVLNWVAI